MRIVDLKSLYREDDGIYYRRKWTGKVDIELVSGIKTLDIVFVIETNALGLKSFDIQIDTSTINYPVVPIITKLKAFIADWESQGKLP